MGHPFGTPQFFAVHGAAQAVCADGVRQRAYGNHRHENGNQTHRARQLVRKFRRLVREFARQGIDAKSLLDQELAANA